MIKILFICHGNICRSTMAQFVFQDMVNKASLSDRFHIDSAATSQLRRRDYEEFDYLIGMDSWNIRNMLSIVGNKDPEGKVARLLDFTSRAGQDIADPWYTGNFDVTYRDVREGCEGLLCQIMEEGI